jgi:hypothetical protein
MMKTAIKANRSIAAFGAAAALALAAFGFAGAAQARDNVTFSVGVAAPGVAVGVTNGYPAYPVYQQPVYVQPAPVYYQPAPVYYPRPVYRPAPVYYQPAPIYYGPRYYPRHGYAPVYYQRPGGHHGHGHGHGRR